MNSIPLWVQRLSMVLVVTLFIGIGVFWESGDQTAQFLTQNQPSYIEEHADVYLKSVKIDEYNEQGQLFSSTLSEETKHLPDGNKTIVTKPTVSLYRDGKTWKIDADSATEHNDELRLTGNIKLTEQNTALLLETDYIHWQKNSAILSSEAQVKASSKQGRLSATGFTVNLDQQHYRLHSKVKGEIYSAQ